jgi:hypothetical protein
VDSSPEAAGTDPYGIAAGDFDGDGDPDLGVVNSGSANVTILRNNGGGNFFEPNSSPEQVGFFPIGIVAAELEGDPDTDLAVTNSGGFDRNVSILRNHGGGNFFENAKSPVPAGPDEPRALVAADFDGDADRDLAVTQGTFGDSVVILRNTGGGNYIQPATSPEPISGAWPYGIAAADFDVDGDPDLATANFLSSASPSTAVSILRNR